MRLSFISSLILLPASAVWALPEKGAASELCVSAPAGPIVGHYAGSGDHVVREFLGIPFGVAPVGPLRFLPPVKKPKWHLPYEAKVFGPACYNSKFQIDFTGGREIPIQLPPPISESEDCLSLNIWAPPAARATPGGAAVMLFIYGGGFAFGSSDTPLYNGNNLVQNQDGVILVTMNYRLNVFGFPGSPALKSNEQNPGLLDVRAGVEWVKNNIAAFGGDPQKITLFGESAGGTATDAYLYYAREDPIISSAILQSGTIFIVTTEIVLGNPAGAWNNLTTALNCARSTPAATLACVRRVPAAKLRDVVNSSKASFTPSIDEGTIFSDTTTRLATGTLARVPMLIGSNNDEVPGADPGAAITALVFTCPAALSTAYRAPFLPTWQYRYFGNFPTGIPNFSSPGAFHGAELPQVFGNYNRTAATAAQRESSQYIQSAWATFAKNPTTGLARLGWPTYKRGANTLVRLAYDNVPGATFADPAVYERPCSGLPAA